MLHPCSSSSKTKVVGTFYQNRQIYQPRILVELSPPLNKRPNTPRA